MRTAVKEQKTERVSHKIKKPYDQESLPIKSKKRHDYFAMELKNAKVQWVQFNKKREKESGRTDLDFTMEKAEDLLKSLPQNARITCYNLFQHNNVKALDSVIEKYIRIKNSFELKSLWSSSSRKKLAKEKVLSLLEELTCIWMKEKINDLDDSKNRENKEPSKSQIQLYNLLVKKKYSLPAYQILLDKFLSIKKQSLTKDLPFSLDKIVMILTEMSTYKLSDKIFLECLNSVEWNNLIELQKFYRTTLLTDLVKLNIPDIVDIDLEPLCFYTQHFLKNERNFHFLWQNYSKIKQAETIAPLLSIFGIVHDYSLTFDDTVKKAIDEIIQAKERQVDLHQYALTKKFNTPSTLISRQQLIREYSKSKSEIKNAEEMFERYLEAPKEIKPIKDKNLNQWTELDFVTWAEHVKTTKNYLLIDAIAVMSEVVNRVYGEKFSLRDTQRLALIELLSEEKCLAEIKTGEGKSLIVVIMAALQALKGDRVDIVTSSIALAKRDAKAEKHVDFYRRLGLRVDHNFHSHEKNQEVYAKSDIIYSDVCHFQADILKDSFLKERTRGNRRFDTVIIDEVDSMLIDHGNDATRLAEPFPGAHHFNYILEYIWRQVEKINQTIADKIDDFDEKTIFQNVHKQILQITGMGWYTNEDIIIYARSQVNQNLGGFLPGKCFIANKIIEGYRVAVIDACALNTHTASTENMEASTIPIFDYYFHKQTDKDVLDELLESNGGKFPEKSKILFPCAVDAIHWCLVEVQLEKKLTQELIAYEVYLYIHNLENGPVIPPIHLMNFQSTIMQRLSTLEPAISEIIMKDSKILPYSWQAKNDRNSCGPIVAEGLWRRIMNKAFNDDHYPPGCQELRQKQKQCVSHEYQLKIEQKRPSAIPKNTFCCYEEKYYFDNHSEGKNIFVDFENTGRVKRFRKILDDLRAGKLVNEEERYSLLAELMERENKNIPHYQAINRFVQNGRVHYRIPEFLLPLFLQEMPNWIDSALQAKYHLQLNKEYRCRDGKILPVDFESTGTTQNQTQWEKGLHQFLQLKHYVPMTSLSLTTNYLFVYDFFLKYGKIYGVTGTLGSPAQQDFLKKIYKVNCIKIPEFKTRQLTRLYPAITPDQALWKKHIKQSILREAEAGRAVVVIFESIRAAKDFKNELENKSLGLLKSPLEIKEYTDAEQRDHRRNIESELQRGQIILATNLAGRGTDFGISEEVEKNKGLHICITFFPKNIRVEEQAAGRAGRKGQPGTWQIITHQQQLVEQGYQQTDDIEALIQERDLYEQTNLHFLHNQHYSINSLKARLFRDFCDWLGKHALDPVRLAAIKEHWAIWLQWHFHEEVLSLLEDDKLSGELKKIENEFEKFRDKLKDFSLVNPYHWIQTGNAYLKKANDSRKQQPSQMESAHINYDLAIKSFREAKSIDPYCAWLSFHNEAFAHIAKSDQSNLLDDQHYEVKDSIEQDNKSELEVKKNQPASLQPDNPSKQSGQYTSSSKVIKPYKAIENLFYQQGRECLEKARDEIRDNLLSILQARYALVCPEADFNLKVIHFEPNDLDIKSTYGTILLFYNGHWNYSFLLESTESRIIKNKVEDSETIKMIDEFARKTGEIQKLEKDIVQHILEKENFQSFFKNTPLLKLKTEEIEFYYDLIAKIDASIKSLEEFKSIGISFQQLSGHKNYHVELQEMGFNGCIGVAKYTTFRFPWEATAVGLLGIVQIAAGAVCLITGVGAIIGPGLIYEGIGDILFAIEAGISGEFSWRAYGQQKLMSFVTSLISGCAKFLVGLGKTVFTAMKMSRLGGKIAQAFSKLYQFGKRVVGFISKISETIKKPFVQTFLKLTDKLKALVEKLWYVQKCFVVPALSKLEKDYLVVLKYVSKKALETTAIKGLSYVAKKSLDSCMGVCREEIKKKISKVIGEDKMFSSNTNIIIGQSVYLNDPGYQHEIFHCIEDSFINKDQAWTSMIPDQFVRACIADSKSSVLQFSHSLINVTLAIKNLKNLLNEINNKLYNIIENTKQKIIDPMIFSENEYQFVIKNACKDLVTYKKYSQKDLTSQFEILNGLYSKLISSKWVDQSYCLVEQNIKDFDFEQNNLGLLEDIRKFLVTILLTVIKEKKYIKTCLTEDYSKESKKIIMLFAEYASNQIVGVIRHEIMCHVHNQISRAINHISNDVLKGKNLESKIKILTDKSEKSNFISKIKNKYTQWSDQIHWSYFLQKTVGGNQNPCRGNLLHAKALSEKYGIPLIIIEKDSGDVIHEHKLICANTADGKQIEPLVLEYDGNNQGHYRYVLFENEKLIIKELASPSENDCLFACFAHYLSKTKAKTITLEQIEKMRLDAAEFLEENSDKYAKQYIVANNQAALFKGGTRQVKSKSKFSSTDEEIKQKHSKVKPEAYYDEKGALCYRGRPSFTHSILKTKPVKEGEDRRHALHFAEQIKRPVLLFANQVIQCEGNEKLRKRFTEMLNKNSLSIPTSLDTMEFNRKATEILLRAFNSAPGNLIAGPADSNQSIDARRRRLENWMKQINPPAGGNSLRFFKPPSGSQSHNLEWPLPELGPLPQPLESKTVASSDTSQLIDDIARTLTTDLVHEGSNKEFNRRGIGNALALYHLMEPDLSSFSKSSQPKILDQIQEGLNHAFECSSNPKSLLAKNSKNT